MNGDLRYTFFGKVNLSMEKTVFERKIYLVDGDRKSKLIAQAEKLAEQYNYGSCFKEFHPDNSGKSIDISNEVTDAFIAGYLAMNERIINERLL